MAEFFNRNGGFFSPPGYLKVETGGSHDENPNGGVQIGVDPQGIPNMLEEGEPVYNDYVYSDNIRADKKFLEQMHLPVKYADKLYSEIADALLAEAEERPLDAISNAGLEKMLGRLADAQDAQKQEQQEKELEQQLENMSPEELAQLDEMMSQQAAQEQMAQKQDMAQQQMPQEQMVPEQAMPVEQPMPYAMGGSLLRKFDGGTPGEIVIPETPPDTGTISQYYDTRMPWQITIDNAIDSNSKLRHLRDGVRRFGDSTLGKVARMFVPSGNATQAFAPAIKPAAGVSKIMDEAYRALEAEKAYEGAYRAADTAKAVSSASDKSKIGKNIWNIAKYFVDPSAVWRSGWAPTSFGGKAAKGVVGTLQSGIVGSAEGALVGNAIGKGMDRISTSKSKEFDVDPFAGRKYNHGGLMRLFPNGTPGEVVGGNTIGALQIQPEGSPLWIDLTHQQYYGPWAPGQSPQELAAAGQAGTNTPPRVRTGAGKVVPPPQKNRTPITAIESDAANPFGTLLNSEKYKRVPFTKDYIPDGDYSTNGLANPGYKPTTVTNNNGNGNVAPDEVGYATWPRFMGLAHNLFTAGVNAFQQPDRYNFPMLRARTPDVEIPNYIDPTYRGIDENRAVNDILATGAGTIRGALNSGVGPGVGTLLASIDNNTTRNIGSARETVASANNQARNAVNAQRNQNIAQRAGMMANLANARAQALAMTDRVNLQTIMRNQMMNNEAEQQWANAVSQPLDFFARGMSDLGWENVNRNMANSMYDYWIDADGHVHYYRKQQTNG